MANDALLESDSLALLQLRGPAPQYLTREQVHQLIGCTHRERERFFCRVAWETGGRVTELIRLVRSDVDLGHRQIRLRTLKRPGHDAAGRRKPKIEYSRWIPVTHSLCADLGDWLLRRSDQPEAGLHEWRLFPFTRQTGHRIVSDAGKRARLRAFGGRAVSPHILRHSYAMNCLNQGVPINLVKELLGHSSILNTMVYLRNHPVEARAFLSKVEF